MNIAKAVLKINKNLDDNDFIVEDHWQWQVLLWKSDNIQKPTQAELETAWAEVEAEEQSTEYQRLRLIEYPPIWEQLDMQYRDILNWTTIWKDLITSIKEKYPKPE